MECFYVSQDSDSAEAKADEFEAAEAEGENAVTEGVSKDKTKSIDKEESEAVEDAGAQVCVYLCTVLFISLVHLCTVLFLSFLLMFLRTRPNLH